jgi:eukaryotic-like serine/threonine-protein kinase
VPYEDLTGTIVKKICMACSREFQGQTVNCPHDGNMLVSLPQDQWEGRRLADRYKIERRLGTGGMGVVYLAWHEMMERWVAIKMLKSSFIEDQQSVRRFQQEAKAASRLKHPNVITLHDFGVSPTGQPYMVMDYLVSTHSDPKHKARSLAQEIKEQGQLSVERCIHILSQACDALEHAHRQGVIHRDVKPANIMIVPKEDDPYFVKVVDFGVAKLLPINSTEGETQGLTQVGEVCGSPVYMSPEQCMGQALDPRADIYSMGVVTYEALTGRLPLVGKNMVETMSKHMNEAPPTFNSVRSDLFIPDKVEQVVNRAMAKQPHARQQSMAELAQDLRFSIPRPGQTPSLKAHEILVELPDPDESTDRPAWMMPAIIGGGIVIAMAAGAIFFGGNHKELPAKVTPAPVQQTVVPPVAPPASVAPVAPAKPIPTATTTAPPPVVSPSAATHETAAVTHSLTTTPKPVVHASPKAHPKVIGDIPKRGADPFEQLKQLKSNYHD